MAGAAIAGGYTGARLGRRIPAPALRAAINVANVTMTAAFFWRTFAPTG
jgi:uncharacterized membrane protein YfcA